MLDPAAYGRSISGIVESLTQAVVQEKTRAEMAEKALAETQQSLTQSILALEPLEASRATLSAEKADLEAARSRDREMLATKDARISELEQRQVATHEALRKLAAAVDGLVPPMCDLLLQAQEAAGDVPQIEPQARSHDDPNSAEAQRDLLQAGIEAAVAAFTKSSRRSDALVEGLLRAAEPLAAMRAARRAADTTRLSTAVGDASASSGAGSSSVEDTAIAAAEDAWRRRVEAQRQQARKADEQGYSAGHAARHAAWHAAPSPSAVKEGAGGTGSDAKVRVIAESRSSEGKGTALGGGGADALVSTKFEVEVPEGAGPGDTLYVTLPTGEQVKVVIPAEGTEGSVLTCSALTRAKS